MDLSATAEAADAAEACDLRCTANKEAREVARAQRYPTRWIGGLEAPVQITQ